MILAQYLANDTRAFLVRAVGTDAHVVHRVQDTAVNRLQAVARIRQRAGDNYAHRVIEVAAAHLLIDVDRANLSNRIHENSSAPVPPPPCKPDERSKWRS